MEEAKKMAPWLGGVREGGKRVTRELDSMANEIGVERKDKESNISLRHRMLIALGELGGVPGHWRGEWWNEYARAYGVGNGAIPILRRADLKQGITWMRTKEKGSW